MGEVFKTSENPLAYIILEYMKEHDKEFQLPKNLKYLKEEIQSFLLYYIGDKDILKKYLMYSFEFHECSDRVIIKTGNIISGLWFSGIFPENEDRVYEEGEYIQGNVIYTFNEKKKDLICKQKK